MRCDWRSIKRCSLCFEWCTRQWCRLKIWNRVEQCKFWMANGPTTDQLAKFYFVSQVYLAKASICFKKLAEIQVWSRWQAIASILQQITDWTIGTSWLNQRRWHFAVEGCHVWVNCLNEIMWWSVNCPCSLWLAMTSNDDKLILLWCAAAVFRRQTFSPIGEVLELPDPSAFFEKTHVSEGFLA